LKQILHKLIYKIYYVIDFYFFKFKSAGVKGLLVTFLFADTQIVNEGFVEDINNLLNSGEVPGLFTTDEKDRVMADIRDYVRALGLAETKDQLYSSFINRSRENLHVVLCMSPVGEAFRARCRQFPSLINCCTIDWFNEWPEEALLSVSTFFLSIVDLGTDEVSYNISSYLKKLFYEFFIGEILTKNILLLFQYLFIHFHPIFSSKP
jgi:dynein heavy chain